jgi:hypothetical protein
MKGGGRERMESNLELRISSFVISSPSPAHRQVFAMKNPIFLMKRHPPKTTDFYHPEKQVENGLPAERMYLKSL